jgi:hypothetical protein
MAEVVVQHSVPNAYAIGVLENILLAVFEKTPTESAVTATATIADGVLARHPSGTGYLHYANAMRVQPPPDQAARNAYVHLMRNYAGRLNAAAVVIEGKGLTAAVVRSVVTGITLIARPPFPVRSFAEPDAAADWLSHSIAPHSPTAHLTPAEIAGALATLRAVLLA